VLRRLIDEHSKRAQVSPNQSDGIIDGRGSHSVAS
jgi:hypothetical protein